jgi:GNAT superfamily N-acetyltransferase
MRAELWPDRAPLEQQQQVEQLLSGQAGLKETGRYQGYLAEDPLSGQPLGLLELGLHEEGRGHLEGLYVTPERRRQGIGGSLLRWAVAELQRWGCRSVTSESWGEHTPGCGLPQRCGFVALDDHGLLEYRGPRLWPELPAPSA